MNRRSSIAISCQRSTSDGEITREIPTLNPVHLTLTIILCATESNDAEGVLLYGYNQRLTAIIQDRNHSRSLLEDH